MRKSDSLHINRPEQPPDPMLMSNVGNHPIIALTADNTDVTADSTIITADQTEYDPDDIL